MPTRGKGKNGGHNHVLAAIADAIHASTSYKGAGKGSKSGKTDGTKNWVQDGRNCPNCDDFNFGFRLVCRQCGTRLPPANGAKAHKGAGKGAASGNSGAWNTGKGTVTESSNSASATPGPAPPPAAKPHSTEDSEQTDPTERVREIRNEEEKLRRTRGQYTENNPRMLAFIDEELQKLAAEREKLQPLEVNLQAAAGRTAHARAALAKAKEKRTAAASELRASMAKYKSADKDVSEAEAKLASAEAAATARRSGVKLAGVDDAVELLRQAATVQCEDASVAAQVATALQQIAGLLGNVAAATRTAPETGDGETAAVGPQTTPGGQPPGTAGDAEPQPARHAVFAACGSNGAKSRRVDGPPTQQNPAAHAAPPGGDGGDGRSGDHTEIFAGGTVDGEVQMGGEGAVDDGNLLSQAGALLGNDNDDI